MCFLSSTEESAYKVLNNPQADGTAIAGIPNQHKDNADVVENICSLFMELSEYSECLLKVLLHDHGGRVIR